MDFIFWEFQFQKKCNLTNASAQVECIKHVYFSKKSMNMEAPKTEKGDPNILGQIGEIKDRIQRSGAVGSEIDDIDSLLRESDLGKITIENVLEKATEIESRRNDYH